MRHLKNPRTLLTLSMCIFGTIPLLVRYIPLSSGEIALWRAALAALMLGIYILISKERLSIGKSRKTLIFLIVSGAVIALNWIFLFESYRFTSVANATLSYYFAPVLVTVLSPIVFKEKVTVLGVISFIVSSVGIVLITGVGEGSESDLIGIALGLAAATLYALAIMFNKTLGRVPLFHRSFLQFVSAAAVLLPYVLFSGKIGIHTLSPSALCALAVLGIVHTGVSYCMYFSAVGNLSGGKIAILSYIDPLLAVVLSVALFGEDITHFQIIGGILILGASLASELLPSLKGRSQNS